MSRMEMQCKKTVRVDSEFELFKSPQVHLLKLMNSLNLDQCATIWDMSISRFGSLDIVDKSKFLKCMVAFPTVFVMMERLRFSKPSSLLCSTLVVRTVDEGQGGSFSRKTSFKLKLLRREEFVSTYRASMA